MAIDQKYLQHPVFDKLLVISGFYDSLSFSIMSYTTLGTESLLNIDSNVYSSMKSTLESISEILKKGRINDAYALLRKFYDAAQINIYTNLYLEENFSFTNFRVEKINNWLNGKEKLPPIRTINSYIQNSPKAKTMYDLLHKDNRYSNIRDRCNDHTHYNFYFNLVINDNQIYFENRLLILNEFSNDLENIFVLHLSYLFYINDLYMMASDYQDNLECGLTPDPESEYYVAPFIQEAFDNFIKKNRPDIALEIKRKTIMRLE